MLGKFSEEKGFSQKVGPIVYSYEFMEKKIVYSLSLSFPGIFKELKIEIMDYVLWVSFMEERLEL